MLTILVNIEYEILQWDWDCLACSKPTVKAAFRVTQHMEVTEVPCVCVKRTLSIFLKVFAVLILKFQK